MSPRGARRGLEAYTRTTTRESDAGSKTTVCPSSKGTTQTTQVQVS